MAAAERPAAILLDMVMPNLDGWAVLKRLRADPALSSTPVIITSMLDDTPRAWDLGIVGWLTKPVEPEHFLSVFRRIGIGASDDVLVVEDDPATRTMIVDHLTEIGIVPRTADDGRAAVAAVDAQLPRAVVLDLMLPHLDGFQVLDHLRACRNGHDIPVVVYTAMDLTSDDRKRLNGGVVEVITKGTGDVHSVVTCVQRALARQPPEERA
jgi:CheY-like chemotaxis protein